MDLYVEYNISGQYTLPPNTPSPRTFARVNIHSMLARRLRDHDDVACYTELAVYLLPREEGDPRDLIRYEGHVYIGIDADITEAALKELSTPRGNYTLIKFEAAP